MTTISNFKDNQGIIQIGNKTNPLNKLIGSYYFYEFSAESDIYLSEILIKNITNSEIAIINMHQINDEKVFFIISFHDTIIIIKKALLHLLAPLFDKKPELKLYFLQETEVIFNQQMPNTNNIHIKCDKSIDEEISNFNDKIYNFSIKDFKYPEMYPYIKSSITRFLIQDSYNKLNQEQIVDFSENFDIKQSEGKKMKINKWDPYKYIELKNIGSGSSADIVLVFEIENKRLYVIKKQKHNPYESDDYPTREFENYLQLNYPLFPKLYEVYQYEDKYYFLKIQYINGKTLNDFKKDELTNEDKLFIIFQLIMIIGYFYEKKFVYRDLKPENIIVDENKTVFVIDFDRMVPEETEILDEQNSTQNFSENYVAPEVNKGRRTHKSDIYSLGKIIEYLLGANTISNGIQILLNEIPDKRPSISELSSEIINILIGKTSEIQYLQDLINIEYDINISIHFLTFAANQNIPQAQLILGVIYLKGQYVAQNINKSIHYLTLAAKHNDAEAQFILADIYYNGKHIKQDINKTIYYLTLAANQNNLQAQYNFGVLYLEGKYIKRDINQAIYYFTLAANQKDPDAQFNLGQIYNDRKYITRDIDKSIHYLTLAANQNHLLAQFLLAKIYFEGEHVARDIGKSIHFLTLAANQNDREAQYNLGVIYYVGQYIARDINKSIQYFALAAYQNYPQAQYMLAKIYYEDQYITRDINKLILNLTLAANQNIPQAQFNLGLIYYEGQYITQDINTSIHYLTLAALQNHLQAQFLLANIFSEGQYIKQDINKSIDYLTLAANQKDPQAQYSLGLIYYDEKYNKRNINKSIYYFKLAANQNISRAQIILGLIYYEGKYITRDIDKSIYYFTLAANQNISQAQYNLGLIYYEGEYIKRDIDKSIHYFTLAANQNDPKAQYNLGLIYYESQYIKLNIDKSIHYLTLAANQNYPKAQFILGVIYYKGEYITQDIDKSIHYFKLAANQNDAEAQFYLGKIFLINQKTNRGLNLLEKSSSSGDIQANFAIGYLYHEGKYLDRNMSKCIEHYKYASSFNDIHSKNNLGVIYKNGAGDEIPKNIGYAIEYFKETVQRWEDKLSMYNLAHIYIYEIKNNDKKIDESIELLIKSSNKDFRPSKCLLCIALIDKHGFDLEKIQNELTEKSNDLVNSIKELILTFNLLEKSFFQSFKKSFETVDYLYDYLYNPVQSKHVLNTKNVRINEKLRNITQDFYDGFGNDI